MLGMGSGMKHPPELRERAVQMVFDLCKESGTDRGAIVRVAERLGVNSETLRGWVKTAEIDSGKRAGTTSDDKKRIAELERELGDKIGTDSQRVSRYETGKITLCRSKIGSAS
jgi:transposase